MPAAVWMIPDAVGEVCRSYEGALSAARWLDRAWEALNIPPSRILHLDFLDRTLQTHQSDRTYPPYLSSGAGGELWIDPQRGMIRESSTNFYPTAGSWTRRVDQLYDRDASWMIQDSAWTLVPEYHAFFRPRYAMDPISVLRDWRTGPVSHMAKVCRYRGEERVVLERRGHWGPERLYLDRESALPLKTDRIEPQYLWGQVRVETVWGTWWAAEGAAGGAPYPVSVVRLQDGAITDDRSVGRMTWVARTDAPLMEAEGPTEPMDPGIQAVTESPFPDTVRVSDNTYLLVNRWYTETVTLQSDTVWVLDATLSEERARQDHEWIRRLFGDGRPVAVVVTDLAWPHVAGIRYWVAQGATIVSHARSEDFLRRVVQRRWTLDPDLLERRRRGVKFNFRPVDESMELAAGRLALYTIGGIGSESALLAWIPSAGYLWAGDYIQRVDVPTTYLSEVAAAVGREGLRPVLFAAQHQGLTDWEVVEALFEVP